MLKVEHLKAGYMADSPVIYDVSFEVKKGDIVALLGSNGVGKTTTLRAITGVIKPMAGDVMFEGRSLLQVSTHELVHMGISMVPEGRHLFGRLSVMDNLMMGAYTINNPAKVAQNLEMVYGIFPRVKERAKQLACTLSGGEQQMVAIARGLMSNPSLLILDEPSLGLMPKLVSEVFEFIQRINRLGVTIVMVEQNATKTLSICNYAYVIKAGENSVHGTGEALLNNEEVKSAYLGVV